MWGETSPFGVTGRECGRSVRVVKEEQQEERGFPVHRTKKEARKREGGESEKAGCATTGSDEERGPFALWPSLYLSFASRSYILAPVPFRTNVALPSSAHNSLRLPCTGLLIQQFQPRADLLPPPRPPRPYPYARASSVPGCGAGLLISSLGYYSKLSLSPSPPFPSPSPSPSPAQ